jgi:hypothetical protein
MDSGHSGGQHGSACRRAGPGLSACAGQNKTRSPPCMRCRGPRLASPHQGQPVAWPSRRGRAARQSQEPALGSGCPAPPTSRSCPRAVPVSNGESISTASARGRARPAPHLFPAFFLSTGSPQNTAGYPHFTVVFHRLLHRSSTGYQALRGGTLSCLHAVEPCSTGFLNSIFLFSRVYGRDNPRNFRWPFRRRPRDHGLGRGRAHPQRGDEDDRPGASSLS